MENNNTTKKCSINFNKRSFISFKLKIKNINIKILNIIIIKNKKKFLLYVKTK